MHRSYYELDVPYPGSSPNFDPLPKSSQNCLDNRDDASTMTASLTGFNWMGADETDA